MRVPHEHRSHSAELHAHRVTEQTMELSVDLVVIRRNAEQQWRSRANDSRMRERWAGQHRVVSHTNQEAANTQVGECHDVRAMFVVRGATRAELRRLGGWNRPKLDEWSSARD